MTISSTNRKAGPYSGNDVAVAFPFAFKVFAARDLYVVRADATGTESVLTLTTDYTISLNADQNANPGGTITLSAALASNYTLTIASQLENLQPTDLTNQGGFYPKVITNALDRLTILIQQLAESVSRSLKTSISTPTGVSSQLPTPVAGNILGWNTDGSAIINYPGQAGTSLVDLAAASGSALVGFKQLGTGAVARTSQDKMRDIVSAKDFGAKLDGTTNDTAAFNNASATGALVFLGKGTAVISAAINLAVAGTSVFGAGIQNTTIYQSTPNAKVFNVTADNCSISGVSLDYSGTPVAGAIAISSTGANSEFHSFKVNRCYDGIFLSTGSSQSAHHFQIYNYVNRGVWIYQTGDAFVDSFVCDAINATNGAGGGLALQNFVEAAHISNGDILNGVYSLVTQAASYVSGSRPAYCTFDSVYFDGAASGSYIDKIVASSFTDCWFSGGRSGGGTHGAQLMQTDEICFSGTKFVGCGSNGCYISANSVRTSFNHCKAQGNAVTSGVGTAAGLVFDVNCDQFQVIGGVYGNSFYGGTQGTGISINAGCTNFLVQGANVMNNASAGIYDGSTSTSGRILDCPGWNPRGGSVITVGASPYTYTAGHSPETIYITGGTVSNITVAGFGMFNATERTVHLGPNETVQVTYSVIPTMRKSVH